MTEGVSTRELQRRLQRLRRERGWERFHTPRSLALALSAEVGELADVLAWAEDGQPLPEEERRAVADELADIASYALHMADILGLDLGAEVDRKLEETRRRFAHLPPGTPSRKSGEDA